MKQYIRNYKDIITLENLLAAWQEFLRGKKKHREDVLQFKTNLIDNVSLLQKELVDKTYVHSEYYAFNISDPKPRNIHKATVRDRLLHHLLYTALYPYFDSKFIYDSYSCRIDKGTHKALYRFESFTRIVSKNNTKTCWVLKCDIKKFFASIDHTILKKILEQHIADKDMLWLLGQVVDSFHTSDKNQVGLPLGNLTSQLLVNVYMNELDRFIKHTLKVNYYIRYADDFVVLSDSKEKLESYIPEIIAFLKTLKLTLHEKKLYIKSLSSGVGFLGWIHFPKHRVLRTTTKRRMFKNLKIKNGASIASYRGMLQHGNAYKLLKKISLN